MIDGESQNKFLKYATRIPAFYTLVLFPSKNQEEFCCWPLQGESRAFKLHSKIFFIPFCFNVYIDVVWSGMKVSVFTFKDLCFMSLDMLMLPLGLFWMSALHRWPTAIYRHNNWTREIRDKSVFSTWDAAGSTTLAGGITFVWQSPFLKHSKEDFFHGDPCAAFCTYPACSTYQSMLWELLCHALKWAISSTIIYTAKELLKQTSVKPEVDLRNA